MIGENKVKNKYYGEVQNFKYKLGDLQKTSNGLKTDK